MADSNRLNTAVIYGSVRRGRQGIKVARFVTNKLKERDHIVTLIDPNEYRLPFLDLMYKEYGPGEAPDAMEKVSQILEKAERRIELLRGVDADGKPIVEPLADDGETTLDEKASSRSRRRSRPSHGNTGRGN
ncbi:MAG: NAD(P)H-dependent oxidoreductase, partial [Proteobacteria bacterium]|nr:NAD(P)H-dependent oxidoreductase [Pseudomonadota bacterium]